MMHVKLLFSLLVYLCFTQLCVGQEGMFSIPLKGVEGIDYFIDYYPDHDTTSGFIDVFCGSKTYDGHRGTDFLLRGYKSMDSGVYIYAAADGRVFEVSDGAYDRSKFWKGGGLGNHVGIIHQHEICTYYGHMMKYSLMVKVGDSVKEGQLIGKVGSSGYSSFPHLHFEVRNKYGQILDPFLGSCSTKKFSYWKSQPPNNTRLFVIEDGFVPYKPNEHFSLDTLQEGYQITDTFSTKVDSVVCFWALMHGLREGDDIHVEWYTPGGVLKTQYNYIWKWHWWHSYTWTYIDMPATRGQWNIKFYVNNKFITSRHFYVTNSVRR